LTIGLEVKKDLNESFSYLVKGEMLDFGNKYHCEQCGSKVKAEKFLSIKKLPKCLIVSLKRFEYDFEIDAKIKINSYCEFPQEIDLKQYTQEVVTANILKESGNALDKSEENN
jgi:ubiquitin carboxyl-terminal hydrolase 9/24